MRKSFRIKKFRLKVFIVLLHIVIPCLTLSGCGFVEGGYLRDENIIAHSPCYLRLSYDPIAFKAVKLDLLEFEIEKILKERERLKLQLEQMRQELILKSQDKKPIE